MGYSILVVEFNENYESDVYDYEYEYGGCCSGERIAGMIGCDKQASVEFMRRLHKQLVKNNGYTIYQIKLTELLGEFIVPILSKIVYRFLVENSWVYSEKFNTQYILHRSELKFAIHSWPYPEHIKCSEPIEFFEYDLSKWYGETDEEWVILHFY